jgi:S1-C subfamily serine protease
VLVLGVVASLADAQQNRTNSPDGAKEDMLRGGFPGVTIGLRINSVTPGGPADRATLGVGDVILAVNRKKVRQVEDLRTFLGGSKVATLTILNGPVNPANKGTVEDYQVYPTADGRIGAGLVRVEVPVAPNVGRIIGLRIDSLISGGPASRATLGVGDVILAVNRKKVRQLDDLRTLLRGYKVATLTILNGPVNPANEGTVEDYQVYPALDGTIGARMVAVEVPFGPNVGRTVGLRIISVARGGPADRAKLGVGDVILAVNRKKVRRFDDLRKLLRDNKVATLTILNGPVNPANEGTVEDYQVYPNADGTIGADVEPVKVPFGPNAAGQDPLGGSRSSISQARLVAETIHLKAAFSTLEAGMPFVRP